MFTYDLATDIGKLRLLISDASEVEPIFQDEELNTFLGLKSNNLQRSAALAYRTIAGSQVLILKVIKLLQLSVDGAAVSRELRQLAANLDESADFDEAASGSLFDWAEMVVNNQSLEDRLRSEILRTNA